LPEFKLNVFELLEIHIHWIILIDYSIAYNFIERDKFIKFI